MFLILTDDDRLLRPAVTGVPSSLVRNKMCVQIFFCNLVFTNDLNPSQTLLCMVETMEVPSSLTSPEACVLSYIVMRMQVYVDPY